MRRLSAREFARRRGETSWTLKARSVLLIYVISPIYEILAPILMPIVPNQITASLRNPSLCPPPPCACSEKLGVATRMLRFITSGEDVGDPRVTRIGLMIDAASALEALRRRQEALYLLEHQRFMLDQADPDSCAAPNHPALDLARSKLLFKDDRGPEALACSGRVVASSLASAPDAASISRAADAYYLMGWASIHMDDHTAAYSHWSRGHAALPGDANLGRQAGKREVWDARSPTDDVNCTGMFGAVARGDGVFDRNNDFESFEVHPSRRSSCAALALFDEGEQRHELVFRTRGAILTKEECSSVLEAVEAYIEEMQGGKWGTVRQASVPTTDVAVEDVPKLRPWLRCLMRRCLFPMLAACYPKLADGTSTIDEKGESRVRLHDAFIVRYDAMDGSFSLPEHSDTSSMR